MKVINLYEATESLLRAKREVIGDEHEIDKRAVVSQNDLDVMLLEHDKPKSELFPNKENTRYAEPRIKGDTKLSEVERLLDL